jgi:hypothetical protein
MSAISTDTTPATSTLTSTLAGLFSPSPSNGSTVTLEQILVLVEAQDRMIRDMASILRRLRRDLDTVMRDAQRAQGVGPMGVV